MITGRDALITLAIKYKQDWDSIKNAIVTKESITEEQIKDALALVKGKCITIVDENYPIEFKRLDQPPFVFFLDPQDQEAFNDTVAKTMCSECTIIRVTEAEVLAMAQSMGFEESYHEMYKVGEAMGLSKAEILTSMYHAMQIIQREKLIVPEAQA